MVCLPRLILSLTSPVWKANFESTAFKRLLLPTPDGPAKAVTYVEAHDVNHRCLSYYMWMSSKPYNQLIYKDQP